MTRPPPIFFRQPIPILFTPRLTGIYCTSTIPQHRAIGELVNLEELWLDDNKLGPNFPAPLLSLKQLKILRLSGNALKYLDPDIGKNLNNLENLALDRNAIEGPLSEEALGPLTSLRVLELAHNHITGISSDCVKGWKQMVSINLSSNRLKQIPSEMFQLPKLECARFDANELKEIPDEAILNRLKQKMTTTTTTSSSSMSNAASAFSALRVLSFANNKITSTRERILHLAVDFSAELENEEGSSSSTKIPPVSSQEDLSDSLGGRAEIVLAGNPLIKALSSTSYADISDVKFTQPMSVSYKKQKR